MAATAGDEQDAPEPRAPSHETRRQLGHQIEKGRKVTLFPADGDDPISGYVAGWDPAEGAGACNYFVLEPTPEGVEQHLIPQSGTRLKLHRESTFEDEKHFVELERILKSFRWHVIQRVLKRGSAAARETTRSGQRRT